MGKLFYIKFSLSITFSSCMKNNLNLQKMLHFVINRHARFLICHLWTLLIETVCKCTINVCWHTRSFVRLVYIRLGTIKVCAIISPRLFGRKKIQINHLPYLKVVVAFYKNIRSWCFISFFTFSSFIERLQNLTLWYLADRFITCL